MQAVGEFFMRNLGRILIGGTAIGGVGLGINAASTQCQLEQQAQGVKKKSDCFQQGWANVFNKGNKIDTEAWMTFLTLKQDVFDSVHELSMIKKKWKTLC